MRPDAWYTLAVAAALLICLIANVAATDVIFLWAITILAMLGIITAEEAFSGFANEGMLTVAMLFIVAAGLRDTGILDGISQRILGRSKTSRSAIFRLSIVIVPFSAFLNNTPIVAMFIPVVLGWCRRMNIAPSKLLIPISYLAILGGTCTLIGTSTNLVVNGMMAKAGVPPMTLFELSWIGIPYAIVGVIYLLTCGNMLLPNRKDLMAQLSESRREYMAEMQVSPKSRLIGKSIEEAGLRQLPGLYVVEIDRAGQLITPVTPDEIVEEGDNLVFTGIVSSIIELEKFSGLQPVDESARSRTAHEKRRGRMCEVVISQTSPLIGQTVRKADFRATYGAAIVAVHRSGSRVARKIGDIRMEPGDTLLLQTGPHFERAYRNDPAFYLVSGVSEYIPLRNDRSWIAGVLLIVLIALMSTSYIPTVVSAALISLTMIAAGCLSTSEARKSIEWSTLITIACAFGVGKALENSGAAAAIARTFVNMTGDSGPWVALSVTYLLVSVITEVITNNACAALMFPICLETAKIYNVSERPFLIALVLAASASFSSPIGYQTNMMVYGPGGYKFLDFFKAGAPLNLTLWIMASLAIPFIWPF